MAHFQHHPVVPLCMLSLCIHYRISSCIFVSKNRASTICMHNSTRQHNVAPVVLSSTFRTHLSGSISLIRLRPIKIFSCSQTIPLSACSTLHHTNIGHAVIFFLINVLNILYCIQQHVYKINKWHSRKRRHSHR